MFFGLLILATCAYSLQAVLMSPFYRSRDCLSMVGMRGASLTLSMSPVLLLVPQEQFSNVPDLLPGVLLAAFAAALGNWSIAVAYRYMPLGIASAGCFAVCAIVVLVLGYAVFDERVALQQLGLIALLLAAMWMLGLASVGPSAVGRIHNVRRGLFAIVVFGVSLGTAYVAVGDSARTYHPLLAGYLWEVLIGLVALVSASLRGLSGGAGISRVSPGDFLQITLRSWPTVVGTSAYAIATTQGPIGIAGAVLATTIVVTTLFGWLIYRERVSSGQIMWICVICGLVAALKLVT